MKQAQCHPRAISVGKSVDLRAVTSVCKATQEIYGCKRWVFDILKAEDHCRKFGLKGLDLDAAIEIIEERFDAWIGH